MSAKYVKPGPLFHDALVIAGSRGVLKERAHVVQFANEVPEEIGRRLAACYTACEGLENPEADIAELRNLWSLIDDAAYGLPSCDCGNTPRENFLLSVRNAVMPIIAKFVKAKP